VSGPSPLVRSAADRLRSDRRRFVEATVVRAERPTSVKPGDSALVLDDGTFVGFVGGECAQASVRAQAHRALQTGEPVLLRIRPDAPASPTDAVEVDAGMVTVHNPCLSGGTLEIFLEPALPPPLMIVHGDAPIARAVRDLAAWMGWDVRSGEASGDPPAGAEAVVLASHGRDEETVLRGALGAGVPYIGLVASPTRGAAVVDGLGLDDGQRRRVRTPAGLDIGSRWPEEVALSIMAELVQRRSRG
jgi:xanthine dehydrogenase accessory factor